MPTCCAVLALVFAFSADGASWRDLDGSYAISGANPFTSGAEERSHLHLQFRGLAARDLYRAMQVEQSTDECTGGSMKAIDGLRCIYFEKNRKYQCDFSIELDSARIGSGLPC